jgi:CRP/FNR family transcriptional regulator, cyclic AMP receptor protein
MYGNKHGSRTDPLHIMIIKSPLNRNQARKDKQAELRFALEHHPFLQGLSADHQEILTGCARRTRFPSDTLILHQGDAADRFFLIEDGCAALEADRKGQGTIRIQTLGAGDVLGWSWLFPPHVYHFSARTVESTDTIIIDAIKLRTRFHQFPELGNVLVKHMAQVVVKRLEATQSQLVEISNLALNAQLQALQLAMSAEPASLR